jgi:uracil-DNA glycosylase
MTADDLHAAFALAPAAWRAACPSWTAELVRDIVEQVRRVSGERPIGPANPFRALGAFGPSQVRVVIVGQDPYPTPGQADGMAFSAERVSPRPSLRRIFDVLEADRPGWRRPASGRLDAWAAQGVLLLNPVLTVELGQIGSHMAVGWQALTSDLIKAAVVQSQASPPVVMAWGSHAQRFVDDALADTPGARVLRSRHPSNDFKREFMADGSHFVATANRVDWWAIGGAAPAMPGLANPAQATIPGI